MSKQAYDEKDETHMSSGSWRSPLTLPDQSNRRWGLVYSSQSLDALSTPTSCNTNRNIPAGKLWQSPLNGQLAKIKGNLLVFLH